MLSKETQLYNMYPTMTDDTKLRNHGVTIAKAMAIMLMVLGHSGSPDWMNNMLGIMRMPLFFLMSGYCFKSKYLDDGKLYLKKRVTGVYVPCVKWSIFFLLMHNVFCHIGFFDADFVSNPENASVFTISQILRRCATMFLFLVPNEQLVGGFWFLHDLFWGSVLFYFVLRLVKKTLIAIILLLSVTMMMSYFEFDLYYLLYPRTVFASCFIAIGYAYKEHGFHFERSWWYIAGTLGLVAAVSVVWHSNFLEFKFMDVIPYLLFAVLGSFMIFGIGERINSLKEGNIKSVLIYIGGKTFNVLTWHMLSFKLVSAMIIFIYGLPWKRIAEFPVIEEYASRGWCVVYFFAGVIVPIMWSFYYDKIKCSLLPFAKRK